MWWPSLGPHTSSTSPPNFLWTNLSLIKFCWQTFLSDQRIFLSQFFDKFFFETTLFFDQHSFKQSCFWTNFFELNYILTHFFSFQIIFNFFKQCFKEIFFGTTFFWAKYFWDKNVFDHNFFEKIFLKLNFFVQDSALVSPSSTHACFIWFLSY